MDEAKIEATPEQLLQGDFTSLSKSEAGSKLRGLLAYEMQAYPTSEHANLHSYYEQLREARLKLAEIYVSLGGEVAPVVLCTKLPFWGKTQRPAVASLVKTHGQSLHNA